MPQIYKNQCYRKGPCLHGTPKRVSRADDWDYYDKGSKSYIYLECRLQKKHYSQSNLEAEVEEQYLSGLSSQQREHPDLQLADTDGTWFTNSNEPENYIWPTWPGQDDSESIEGVVDDYRSCKSCDIICDIRNDKRYLNDDGSCPYPDPAPQLKYWKVEDNDQPCQDFLHPLLLQDIPAINRRRRRMAKSKLWGYLKQKKWRDLRITKGERMIDIWKRNYQPVTFYFKSFETIWLYIKNLPPEMKENQHLLRRIRDNLEYSPSYEQNLAKGEWEQRMLNKIDQNVKNTN
jgi:hypothetical protein